MAKKRPDSIDVIPLGKSSAKVKLDVSDTWIDEDADALVVMRSRSGAVHDHPRGADHTSLLKDTIPAQSIGSVTSISPLQIEVASPSWSTPSDFDSYHIYKGDGSEVERLVAATAGRFDGVTPVGAAYGQLEGGLAFIMGGWYPDDVTSPVGAGIMSNKGWKAVASGGIGDLALHGEYSELMRVWATLVPASTTEFFLFGGHSVPGGQTSGPDDNPVYETANNLWKITVSLGSFDIVSVAALTGHADLIGDGIAATASDSTYIYWAGGRVIGEGAPRSSVGRIHKTTGVVEVTPAGFQNLSAGRAFGLFEKDDNRNAMYYLGGATDIGLTSKTSSRLVSRSQTEAYAGGSIERSTRMVGTGPTDIFTYNPGPKVPARFIDTSTSLEIQPLTYSTTSPYPATFSTSVDVIAVAVNESQNHQVHTVTGSTAYNVVHSYGDDKGNISIHVWREVGGNFETVNPASISHPDNNSIDFTFSTTDTFSILLDNAPADGVTPGAGETNGWEAHNTNATPTSSLGVNHNMGSDPANHFTYPMYYRRYDTGELLSPSLVSKIGPSNLTSDFSSAVPPIIFVRQSKVPASDGDVSNRAQEFSNSMHGFGIARLDDTSSYYGMVVGDFGSTPQVYEAEQSQRVAGSYWLWQARTQDGSGDILEMAQEHGYYLFARPASGEYDGFRHGGTDTSLASYDTTNGGLDWNKDSVVNLDFGGGGAPPTFDRITFHSDDRMGIASAPGDWFISRVPLEPMLLWSSAEAGAQSVASGTEVSFLDYNYDDLALPGPLVLKAASTTTKLVIDIPSSWADKEGNPWDYDVDFFAGKYAVLMVGSGSTWTHTRKKIVRSGETATGSEAVLYIAEDDAFDAVSTSDYVAVHNALEDGAHTLTAMTVSIEDDVGNDDLHSAQSNRMYFDARKASAPAANQITLSDSAAGNDRLLGLTADDMAGWKVLYTFTASPGFAPPSLVGVISDKVDDETIEIETSNAASFGASLLITSDFENDEIPQVSATEWYFEDLGRYTRLPPNIRTDSTNDFTDLMALEAGRNRAIGKDFRANDVRIMPKSSLVNLGRTFGLLGHDSLDIDSLRRVVENYSSNLSKRRGTLDGIERAWLAAFDKSPEFQFSSVELRGDDPAPNKVKVTVSGTDATDRLMVGSTVRIVDYAGSNNHGGTFFVETIIDGNNFTYDFGQPLGASAHSGEAYHKAVSLQDAGLYGIEAATQKVLRINPEALSRDGSMITTAPFTSVPRVDTTPFGGQFTLQGTAQTPLGLTAATGDYLYFLHEGSRLSRGYKIFSRLGDIYYIAGQQFAEESGRFDYNTSKFFALTPTENARFQWLLAWIGRHLPQHVSVVFWDG